MTVVFRHNFCAIVHNFFFVSPCINIDTFCSCIILFLLFLYIYDILCCNKMITVTTEQKPFFCRIKILCFMLWKYITYSRAPGWKNEWIKNEKEIFFPRCNWDVMFVVWLKGFLKIFVTEFLLWLVFICCVVLTNLATPNFLEILWF